MNFRVTSIELSAIGIASLLFLFFNFELFLISVFALLFLAYFHKKEGSISLSKLFFGIMIATFLIAILSYHFSAGIWYISYSIVLYSVAIAFLVLGIYAFDDYLGDVIIIDNNFFEFIIRVIIMVIIYVIAMEFGFLVFQESMIY